MNKALQVLTFLLCVNLMSFGNNSNGFIENKGQVVDMDQHARNEFLFYSKSEKLDVYFRKEGITYIFKKGSDIPKNIGLTKEKELEVMRAFLQEKTLYYRLDMDFVNAAPGCTVEGGDKTEGYNNFYYAHCPNGVLNVSSFHKVKYKNVYEGISFEFYIKDGKFKYDVIVEPNADINRIHLKYNGAKSISLLNNELNITSEVGDITETLPRSFTTTKNGKEKEETVHYILKGDEVHFKSDYSSSNVLTIDPQISWTTYYDNSFWNGSGSNIDVKGTQFVISSSGFNNFFPTLNPGGGAYYQNANAGSSDFELLQFNTSGVLRWVTYYGGTALDYGPDVKLDYAGNIVMVGHTEGGTIPTQSAGGYFDGTYNAGTYGGAAFVLKFNSTGVRQWGTFYDFIQYPMLDIDQNNNIYVAARAEYDNPPVLALAGAYNQATPSPDAGSGKSMDIFIVKFNAATARTWATNLGSTCDEYLSDIKCGSDNFLNILAGGDNYYGTGIITRNAGGYFDNTLGIGSGGSSTDREDALIYRFNTANALVWGTAFSGTNNENVQRGKITTDAANNIYIYGETRSTDLPTVNPGGGAYFDNIFNTTGGATFIPFISKFNSSTALTWSTYFGTCGLGYGMNFSSFIGINNKNNLIVATTDGGGIPGTFPLVNRAGDYNSAMTAYMGVYIAEFNSSQNIDWSTYYSGTTDRNTLGEAALFSNTCGYEIYMTTNWEKYSGTAIDPPWVNPGGAYQNTTFDATRGSGLISRFSHLGTTTVQTPTICSGSNYSLPGGGTASATGIYTVTLTSINGCDSVIKVNLTVNSAPTIGIASVSSNPICPGNNSVITPSGASTYTLFPGNTTGTSFNVSPASATTYTIRGTNSNGCVAETNTTINVNTNSSAPTSINTTNASVCSGGNTTLTVNGGSLGTAANWQWFSGSCNGTPAGTGTSIVVSPGSTTTYYVNAAGTCNTTGCANTTINVNTNSSAPTAINATTSTICSGNNTTLSVSGGSLGTAANWQWFTGSCNGTPAGTGSSIVVSPGSATTYYVNAVGTCNTTGCASTVINVNTNSSAPTAINATTSTICSGNNTTLSVSGGSLGTAANWQWFTGSCNGTPAGTGSSIVVSPGSATTYYVNASGTCNTTSCASTVINVNTNSSAPTAINTSTSTICPGNNTTLTVSGGSLGTAANWQWFTGSCNGTPAGSGTSIVVSPGSATTYYVNAVGSCNTTSCANTTINVNTTSTAPISINTTTTSLCSGNSATLTVNGGSLGTAANWAWYTGSCGGTLAGTGSSIVVSPASTTTYYLRAEGTCGNTSCVSTIITMNAVSSAPASISASTATVCSGATTTLTVNGGSLGSGASWQWFSGNCSGTAAGTGNAITVSPSSTTTYFVKAVGSCNTTICSSVTVNVNSSSTAPTSANPSAGAICSGNSSTLTVSGGSLGTGGTWQWYANGCGTTPVGSGSSIVVSPAITTAYFVRGEGACGNSICSQVTITVTATPSAAWNSPGTICSGAGNLNLSALVTGNTGGSWSGTGVTGTTFDPSALIGQTIPVTYSVANGSCSSSITHSISVAGSVSANWNSPGNLCASAGTVNLINYITGSNGGTWSGSGVSGSIFDPSAMSGAIAITYSVGSGSCSDVKTFTINVTPAATASWTTPGTLCASNGTVNLNTYLTGTAGGTWTGTGVSGNIFNPSALAGQTILISYLVGINPCTATESHTIQVVNMANASFALPASLCENASILNLNNTITGNTGGVFSGTGVSGNNFNPTGLAGQSIVITYSVGTLPCGGTQSHTITISSAPVMPTVAVSNTVICSGQTTTVTANGSGGSAVYTVYSSPGATGALGSAPLALSPTVTTTYYLQAVAGGCSNLGGDVPFTITVNPTPNAEAGDNQGICMGSNTILTASGGGSYLWNTGATTHSIVVTPTVNTTYTVTVTNTNGCVAQDVVTVTLTTGSSLQANNDAASVQSNSTIAVNVAGNDSGDPNTVAVVSGPYHGSIAVGANGVITYVPNDNYEGTDSLTYSICDVSCSMICRTAKLVITVTKEIIIKVPGGFSPNGDGKNDGFVIEGLDHYPNNELVIFNRWGDEIFKAAPYKNDWVGQSQSKGLTLYGTELVDGTYFYILILDKEMKPMKGYVELKRK